MKNTRTTATRLVAAALCLAAVPALSPAGVGQYFEDRVYDFVDVFRLRVGIPNNGNAYGAKARITTLAQAGYVHFEGDYVGLDRRGFGWMEERRTEGGASFLYASRHESIPRWGNTYHMGETLWSEVENRRIVRNEVYWDDGRGDLLGVGAEVATPILALEAGVNPSQALDFVTGIFLIDLFNDDELGMDDYWRYNIASPLGPPVPDMEAATRAKKAEMAASLERTAMLQSMQETGELSPMPARVGGMPGAELQEPDMPGSNEPGVDGLEPMRDSGTQPLNGAGPGDAGPREGQPLSAKDLNKIIREGETVEWMPVVPPPPADN